jgi:GNAT superfamily N-acetyltransferase
MNIEDIRHLYDREQRKELCIPGMRREVDGNIIRHVNLTGGEGMIIYSRLTEADLEPTIRDQVAYFERIGQDVEWKVYSHDTPPDLKDRLHESGFAVGDDEAILVLDLEQAPDILTQPITHAIRRITDPDQVQDAIAVQHQVWNSNFDWLAQRLTRNLRERPDYLSIYVVYEDGEPVAAAWINFPPQNQFASLWGGSTLANYRKRGIYTALLAVRVQQARRMGIRFLTVDASAMSRPILQKLGFQLISYAYPCVWHVQRSRANNQTTTT